MINMVREFFANGKEVVDNRCHVRGKWLPFDFMAINRLFKLRDFKFNEYTPFSLTLINPDEFQLLKSWHYFILSHLLPRKNINEIGYTIDVRKLICSSLNCIIRGTTSVGLGHLSLIYSFCVNAGVRGDPNEEHIFPILALTKNRVLKG
ncbi:hypothetical protein IEQ34_012290 [Dendrobium chrysotoxum]|uniref:Putative plant transposon protein domain-containing protein n=1 Tax=Dendrobium chrysotoxum TaxID=161865 RepID=A0AAV7GS56_DENCH|nr:hypothetical protein IEQ34_012290 [Dendrobium chrysotoxum]